MKVVFFGSSSFSVPPLQSIASRISCIVTRKAKPKGRGYLLEDTEVRREAINLQLPVIEIDSFKDESIKKLESLRPDFFVVASFGLIIPKWALEIPSIGPINIHPSLLPKYRGPSPIQLTLLNGDGETGITIMRINEKMDAGNILYQETMVVEPADNAITLSERLSKRSGEILPGFLDEVSVNGLREGLVQDHDKATYTPILTKEMGSIDWSKSATGILLQARAFVAWPTAYTFLDGLMLKVFEGTVMEDKGQDERSAIPGTIFKISKDGIHVCTGSGVFVIKELQLQNKKRMKAYDFSQGYRGLSGKVLKKG
jgi:methionyl-tRNA formyltransferase